MICKITNFFTNFFSTEKKFVKFVIFYEWKKFVKFEFSIYVVQHVWRGTKHRQTDFGVEPNRRDSRSSVTDGRTDIRVAYVGRQKNSWVCCIWGWKLSPISWLFRRAIVMVNEKLQSSTLSSSQLSTYNDQSAPRRLCHPVGSNQRDWKQLVTASFGVYCLQFLLLAPRWRRRTDLPDAYPAVWTYATQQTSDIVPQTWTINLLQFINSWDDCEKMS